MLYKTSLLSLLILLSIPFLHSQQVPLLPQQDLNQDFNKAQQDEFNEMLAALQEMPEDKLQEFEKALEEEVKQELQKMSPQERKEFDDKMAEFWLAQGIDPNTIPPIEEMFAQPTNDLPEEQPAPSVTEEEFRSPTIVPTITAPTASLHSEEEVAETLAALIKRIDSLRTKAVSDMPEFKRLGSWKEALDELSYDLKMINKPEHHARLVNKEFAKLFKLLQNLRDKLTIYEPLAGEAELEETDNPYDILRVPSNASDDLIEKTFKKYAAERDPETLRAKLTKEGLSENDIEGQIKSAQLSLNTLTEAYEKLSDPKLRAQTDRSLKAARLYRESAETESKKAIDAILQYLSTVVYQQKILTELEQFLQKYAPVELAAHKKMMEAEAKRKKEQAEASKIQPAIGYVAPEYYPYNPTTNYQQPSAQPNYPNYYPDYYPEHYEPQAAPAGKEEKDKKAGGDKSGDKGKEKPKEEKDKKDKENADKKSAQEKEKKEKAKPTAEDEWKDAVKKVTTELEQAQKTLNAQNAADKKIFDEQLAQFGALPPEEQMRRRAAGRVNELYEPLTRSAAELTNQIDKIETEQKRALDTATDLASKAQAAGGDPEEIQKELDARFEEINAARAEQFNRLRPAIDAVYNGSQRLFATVNLGTLNKAVKSLALATEKAQELGFALTYGTTWKKLADKYQDIFKVADIYGRIIPEQLPRLEADLLGARAVPGELGADATEAELEGRADTIRRRAETAARATKEIGELKQHGTAIENLGKNLAELQELIQPGRRMGMPRAPQETPADQMREFQDAQIAAKEKVAAAAAAE
jgi:curved DNA-binding protein CbpA